MSFVYDGHAHIFPGKIAAKASESIGEFYEMPMAFDGTSETLLKLGDRHGVEKFLVHSVATTPAQVETINNFIAGEVAGHPGRFIGFASLHPGMDDISAEVDRVCAMGFAGIKLHPDFQKFALNSGEAYRIYECCENRLPILVHTGDRRRDYSHPGYIPGVLRDFPGLKLICAHFGGWSEWEEAEQCLKGLDVWVDTSSSMYAMSDERAKSLIGAFGRDRVIFGSDYPMWNPGDEIRRIEGFNLSEDLLERLFYKNLCELLDIK